MHHQGVWDLVLKYSTVSGGDCRRCEKCEVWGKKGAKSQKLHELHELQKLHELHTDTLLIYRFTNLSPFSEILTGLIDEHCTLAFLSACGNK